MTQDKPEEDRILRLHAAVDGELRGSELDAFERECARDPEYRKLYEQMLALREATRGLSESVKLPLDVKHRVADRVFAQSATRVSALGRGQWRHWPWGALAACLLLAFSLGGLATGLMMRRDAGSQIAMQLVDDHRRALLAQSQFDIASSDRHTVRPWFDAHLALSPPVVDLAQQGYPLLGGRVAVISGLAVPVLVYRIREHVITLAALPADRFASVTNGLEVSGYNVETVHRESFNYVAVSDVERADLEAFMRLYQSQSSLGESQP
jgi:anti-sigma factor RsiW